MLNPHPNFSNNPIELINTQLYPIHNPNCIKYLSLIANCHDQLEKSGMCMLPNFIDSDVLEKMAEQANNLSIISLKDPGILYPYGKNNGKFLPKNHPSNSNFTSSLEVIAYDQIPKNDLIRQLYEWDCLTSFIATILQIKKLYRFADEFQSLNITLMGDSDHLGWHYDSSDFVITLLLQKSISGGEFEFAPMIRKENDENFDDVAKLFQGKYDHNQVISQEPGTLVLFKGKYSMHRVRTIYGPQKRITAILSYDPKSNYTSSDELNSQIYGERVVKIYEERKRSK